MKLVKGFLRGLDYIEETIIVLLLAFMCIMNFINVIFRYLFASSFSFTEELTVMAFVWVTMMGIATGYKRCGHELCRRAVPQEGTGAVCAVLHDLFADHDRHADQIWREHGAGSDYAQRQNAGPADAQLLSGTFHSGRRRVYGGPYIAVRL